MIVVDIFGELLVLEKKVVVAQRLCVFLLVGDYVIIKQEMLFSGLNFWSNLFFVPDKLSIVLLCILEGLGVKTFYVSHLFNRIYLPKLVHIHESSLVPHSY